MNDDEPPFLDSHSVKETDSYRLGELVRKMLAPEANKGIKSATECRWEPPSLDRLRDQFPDCSITRLIACGGMAAVYLGVQKSLNRTVAIKVLPPGIDNGEMQFAARFKQEAESMAQFSHPNLVTVFDAGETEDGLLCIVMEFIDGIHVGNLIEGQGRLEQNQAIKIIQKVCEALEFLHGEGFIHRDIKPSNILLNKKGQVKVADFGLVKAINHENLARTNSKIAIGTPDFVAPEMLNPDIEADHRADLYSVGVMLYQMLTGQIPRGRFPLPSQAVPGLDSRLDAIVDHAMQPNPENRYASAGEMLKDLEELERGLSNAPPDLTVALIASGSAPKKDWKQAAFRFLLGTLAVAALVGGAQWMRTHSSNDGGREQTGKPSGQIEMREPKGRAGEVSGKIRNIISTEISFPVGQWIKLIDSPEDLPSDLLEPDSGVTWEDGWLASRGKALQWQVQRIGLGRNHGIRATFKDFSPLKLSRLRVRHRGALRYDLTEMAGRLRYFDQSNEAETLSDWLEKDRWTDIVPGSQFNAELIVIDSLIFARINGQLIDVTDDRIIEGGASFLIQRQAIRDIEVINLDGLSETEARKAAGLPEATPLVSLP